MELRDSMCELGVLLLCTCYEYVFTQDCAQEMRVFSCNPLENSYFRRVFPPSNVGASIVS